MGGIQSFATFIGNKCGRQEPRIVDLMQHTAFRQKTYKGVFTETRQVVEYVGDVALQGGLLVCTYQMTM